MENPALPPAELTVRVERPRPTAAIMADGMSALGIAHPATKSRRFCYISTWGRWVSSAGQRYRQIIRQWQ
ncbi:hypothetical protein [Micromonospora chokoriensis]|uniref:hypothetical protein n=1 Tax=Micromonospora chokoriensis TaxID=356851 RepID=UPI000B5ADF20|nr:hypothetical protein [Micromonospora chokoriensis]